MAIAGSDVNRESTLGVLVVAVLVGAAALVLLSPGALADRADDPRQSYLDLREPRVAAGDVGGETAELSLDVRLEHSGGPAENVTVEVQVIDSDTGLVETTVRNSLGTLSGEREVRTRLNVTVDRQGGYRMDVRVYEDGRRVATAQTDVSGVESLTPAYADTPIEFHRFGSGPASVPVVGYEVQGTADGRTTLRTQTHLTNRGDETAGGLELVVTARQVESNVIADRATVQVGDIGPGRTATPTATLDVPANYNYYLDAVLTKDGVIVNSVTASAMLDPTRPVPENRTTEEVEFDAGDFASGSPTPDPDDREPEPTAVSRGPGFGVLASMIAIFAIAVAATRRHT